MTDTTQPPAKKSLLRSILDFFSPNYVFPQPKGRRVQGGPAQVQAFWAEQEKKREAAK
jgi:hypothetical protein